jgi:acyl-coenzyme A synthetase/AMP-(fatty) acid ligase
VRGLVRDAFGDGSAWLVTNDVLERDAAGRHWFVDSLAGFVRPASGGDAVSLRRVEDALYALPEVQLAAAWETTRGSGAIAAAFVSRVEVASERLEAALSTLPAGARPKRVARVPEIPLTEGFRPKKRALPVLLAEQAWGLGPRASNEIEASGLGPRASCASSNASESAAKTEAEAED